MLNISDFYKVHKIIKHKMAHRNWNETKNNIKNTEEKFVGKTYTYFNQIIKFCGHKYMPDSIKEQVKQLIPTIINGLNAFHTLIEIVSTADMDGYREELIENKRIEEENEKAQFYFDQFMEHATNEMKEQMLNRLKQSYNEAA